jgi:DNA-binding winged helix-turn-helix (wHTH) protein
VDKIIRQALHFDRFTLDLAGGCLRSGTTELYLRPKAFRVLQHLVENAGRLVGKEELQTVAWGSVVVTDDSLVQCIRQLRRTLDDHDHRLIKTIARRGYRLDASVWEPTAQPEGDTTRQLLATVLYTDIRLFLEGHGEREPYHALRVLEAVHAIMVDAVGDHQGIVYSVTPDGVLALFEADGRENHALRGYKAALQIRQAVKVYCEQHGPTATPIDVRAGLCSGQLLVRSADRASRPASFAMGAPLLAALKLAERAGPGQLLLDNECRRWVDYQVETKAPPAENVRRETVAELTGSRQTSFYTLAHEGWQVWRTSYRRLLERSVNDRPSAASAEDASRIDNVYRLAHRRVFADRHISVDTQHRVNSFNHFLRARQ